VDIHIQSLDHLNRDSSQNSWPHNKVAIPPSATQIIIMESSDDESLESLPAGVVVYTEDEIINIGLRTIGLKDYRALL